MRERVWKELSSGEKIILDFACKRKMFEFHSTKSLAEHSNATKHRDSLGRNCSLVHDKAILSAPQ